MQGINAKDHQMMIAVFNKFEQMAIVARDRIPDDDNLKTREGMAELTTIYGIFRRMMEELQDCVKHYNMRRRSVQSLMNINISYDARVKQAQAAERGKFQFI